MSNRNGLLVLGAAAAAAWWFGSSSSSSAAAAPIAPTSPAPTSSRWHHDGHGGPSWTHGGNNSNQSQAGYDPQTGQWVDPNANTSDTMTAAATTSQATDVFDPWDFLAANPDLLGKLGANAKAATHYWYTKGKAEGRKSTFDGMEYLASNPDLLDAFGPDPQAAVMHYVSQGFWEGRPTATFDPVAWGATQPNLGDMYGQDVYSKPAALLLAYVTDGRAAERQAQGTDSAYSVAVRASG